MTATQMSPGLKAWAARALELGLGWFSGGNLTPFILFDDASGQGQLVDLQNVSGVVGPELVEVGRAIIRDFEPGQFYALGWDGFLTTAGIRQDAVFAEVGASGEVLAYVFAQRYKQAGSGELARVDLPLVAAVTANLWPRQKGRRRARRVGAASRRRGRRPTSRR